MNYDLLRLARLTLAHLLVKVGHRAVSTGVRLSGTGQAVLEPVSPLRLVRHGELEVGRALTDEQAADLAAEWTRRYRAGGFPSLAAATYSNYAQSHRPAGDAS